MTPVRRQRDLFSQLTTATKLAIALVVGSVVCALSKPMAELLLLDVDLVIGRLQLWRPLTYGFVDSSPMGVIFGALILWSIGGALESSWGSRRIVLFAVGSTVAAGFVTCLLALIPHFLPRFIYPGGGVMATTLWVAYGLSVGPRQSNFWGLPVTGNVLALIGVGFVFLNGAFGSFYAIIPEAIGVLIAFLYVRRLTPNMLVLRLRSYFLERKLKMRSKHLRLISKERNVRSDSDRYLH